MEVAEEELQMLGKPQIFSRKEDERSEWSFVMKSNVSLLSIHMPAFFAGEEASDHAH